MSMEDDKQELKALKELEASYEALPVKKRAFLEAFSKVGTITEAANIVGISRHTFYYYKKSDPKFAELFVLADEVFTEKLELELYKRAMGEHEAKMSDVLLMFLLKARRPNVYREKPNLLPMVGDITIKFWSGVNIKGGANALQGQGERPLLAPAEEEGEK